MKYLPLPSLRRKTLALIIPAHNEELVIEATLRSAIAAGQAPEDIYVVDDASTDQTVALASTLIDPENILSVPHSGKARAIKKAVAYFNLTRHYQWIHIADADGVFDQSYFAEFRKGISGTRAVAATGYIQSLPGGWISKYRTYEYTIAMEIMRRIQRLFGVITVIPGPTSCFRSRIFHQLDFDVDSLTEDFDVTLQIHRKRLGTIQFIPGARTYTQDPKNFRDYLKQVTRWYRGNFQGIKRHKIGRRFQRVDAFLSYILYEQFLLVAELIMLPYAAFVLHSVFILAVAFLWDLGIFLAMNIWAARVNRRYDILGAFPVFYILRLASLVVFTKAFIEVVVLGMFSSTNPRWETKGRRYRITDVPLVMKRKEV